MFWYCRIVLPLLLVFLILNFISHNEVIALVLASLYITGCNLIYWYTGSVEKYFHDWEPTEGAMDKVQHLWQKHNLFFVAWFLAPLPVITIIYLAFYLNGIDGLSTLRASFGYPAGLWIASAGMLTAYTCIIDLLCCCIGNAFERDYLRLPGGSYDPWRG
jgi:uncharacterized membrane protein